MGVSNQGKTMECLQAMMVRAPAAPLALLPWVEDVCIPAQRKSLQMVKASSPWPGDVCISAQRKSLEVVNNSGNMAEVERTVSGKGDLQRIHDLPF
jgi:hypothetical protein